jgi:hypothetical protein
MLQSPASASSIAVATKLGNAPVAQHTVSECRDTLLGPCTRDDRKCSQKVMPAPSCRNVEARFI